MKTKSCFIKLLQYKNFGIRPLNYLLKFIFPLTVISLLNACITEQEMKPYHMPELVYLESNQSAYIWISGERISFWNKSHYASVIKIDGIYVPAEFLPVANSAPTLSKLLKIPAGRHTTEILYKEDTKSCGYKDCIVINKSKQTLTFITEANRTYAPFVDIKCSRAWFWIEDWGPFTTGTKTTRSTIKNRSDLTKLVVAGKAPTNISCI